MEEIIPPGLRFYPTEEELVSFYLRNKLDQKMTPQINRVIPVLDVYGHDPCNLPKHSGEVCCGDSEQWFFFVPRQEREERGGRPSRTTATGYWKATGSPGYVYSSDNRVIGMKKTMVFYEGKSPTGRKTKWKMNEYRAIEEHADSSSSTSIITRLRDELSLCRVYVISGSFRAFDRRPPAAKMTVGQPRNGDRWSPESCSKTTGKVEKTESSAAESSHSGEAHQHHHCVVENEGSSSLGGWKMTDTEEVELHLWDWEQLNWL